MGLTGGEREVNRRGMGLTRREFLMRCAAAGVAMATGSGAYAYAVEPRWVELTRRTITVPGWPSAFDGLRVAHLTDLHHSPIVSLEFLESSVALVNAERPDVVALTGDYITRRESRDFIAPMAAAVGKLEAPLGVFATLGNHDVWVDGPRVRGALARHGCAVLRNQSIELSRLGGRLSVVGIGDLWTEGVNLRAAFGRVPAGRASLILMHNPDLFEWWPAALPGMILAGHTHGGQVALPGFGPPYIPSRFGKKYAQGLFQRPGASMYVNRGLGTLHFPVRFLARPEIALFTIRAA